MGYDVNEEAELVRLEEDRKRQRDAHIAWLASRPRWATWGKSLGNDPEKRRRSMEETSRYLGESRDV